jgi:hypothetical protein
MILKRNMLNGANNMKNKVTEQINEAINESKEQFKTISQKGVKLAEKGMEIAGKARNKAEESAAAGASALAKMSDSVHKENLLRIAESVKEEIRTTLFSTTINEIAVVKDEADELRRKIGDMQKIYDKKFADLQAELKAVKAAAPKVVTPKPEAPKPAASKPAAPKAAK